MPGFLLKTTTQTIRFRYYTDAAPVTVEAFNNQLPFTLTLMHARISGQEIWTDHAPALDIIQENASVFTQPGEVVLGPIKPTRTKTAGCLGIYYGEGKGLDACNIFAKILDEDLPLLKELGEEIWKRGEQSVTFEKMDEELALAKVYDKAKSKKQKFSPAEEVFRRIERKSNK
jgi:hypothetical protein